jgi:hypothetical protein
MVTIPAPDPNLLDTADAIVVSRAGLSDPAAPQGIARGPGEGASVAMGQWAQGSADAILNDPVPGLAVLIVTLPIAAIVGAASAHSAEDVDAAKQTFAAVAAEPNLLPTLERRIAAVVREQSPARWGCVAAFEAGDVPPCADAKAAATLEIRASYVPVMKGRRDPEIFVAAMIEAKLKPHRGEISSMRWRYDSPTRRFFDLTANGGAALRSELDTMLDRLAQAVARDMITDPEPITAEVWVGGPDFSLDYRDPMVRQSNVPKDTSPGVARRMHPQEPVQHALEAGLKATILGKGSYWLGPCRIAKIDDTTALPPLVNANLQPGQSPIATADPGDHVFTVTCPTTGDDNWAPREIRAAVEAGRVYCTDGKSFADVTGRGSCK